MYLPFLPAGIMPFFARRMVTCLSWYRILLSIVYTYPSMKYIHHKITPRTSSIYFLPIPTQWSSPHSSCVSLLCSQCHPFPLVSFHWCVPWNFNVQYPNRTIHPPHNGAKIFYRQAPFNVQGTLSFRYITPCLNFPQLSLSGCFTLVVRKEKHVSTAGLALLHRNRSQTVIL